MSSAPPQPEPSGAPSAATHPRFTCRYCGREHEPVALRSRQKACCVRCGMTLAQGTAFGGDALPALVLTALAFAGPALLLPFVTIGKLGTQHHGHLLSGAEALWREGMRLLAVWVALCGTLAPILMLLTLAALTLPGRIGATVSGHRWLLGAAEVCEEWAMPEVNVLGVLVALTKLGTLVDVRIESGFWCYAASSLLLLFAWRLYRFAPTPRPAAAGTASAS